MKYLMFLILIITSCTFKTSVKYTVLEKYKDNIDYYIKFKNLTKDTAVIMSTSGSQFYTLNIGDTFIIKEDDPYYTRIWIRNGNYIHKPYEYYRKN